MHWGSVFARECMDYINGSLLISSCLPWCIQAQAGAEWGCGRSSPAEDEQGSNNPNKKITDVLEALLAVACIFIAAIYHPPSLCRFPFAI